MPLSGNWKSWSHRGPRTPNPFATAGGTRGLAIRPGGRGRADERRRGGVAQPQPHAWMGDPDVVRAKRPATAPRPRGRELFGRIPSPTARNPATPMRAGGNATVARSARRDESGEMSGAIAIPVPFGRRRPRQSTRDPPATDGDRNGAAAATLPISVARFGGANRNRTGRAPPKRFSRAVPATARSSIPANGRAACGFASGRKA